MGVPSPNVDLRDRFLALEREGEEHKEETGEEAALEEEVNEESMLEAYNGGTQ